MKNNSFRKTFYLGLVFLLILSGILIVVGVNIYKAVSTTNKKPIIEDVVIIYEKPEDSLVSNTPNFEKPIIKDTIKPIEKVKIPTVSPVVMVKKDTTNKSDSVR
jgi:hypothetical protein